MNQITISRKEYTLLKRRASAYHQLMGKLFEAALKDPIEETVEDFRRTGLYTDAFVHDIEDGLRKSSYARQ